jgi:peptidyl-prolyl cis-trans isomerase C
MSTSVDALVPEGIVTTATSTEAKPLNPRSNRALRRWMQEPLIHFLLIGAVLFAGYTWLTPSSSPSTSNRIELTADDVKQLQVMWMAQWQRLPTPEELQGLIETKVRQEVLYREALTLGLDQSDEIIKRRLAQKMEFLGEDVSAMGTPSSEELKAWFETSAAKFALPGRLTFRHLYFSPDNRGERAKQDADAALKSLSARPGNPAPEVTLGDRFVDQNYFADCLSEQITKVFGSKFSESLFKLTSSGSWQGPVESGLGWHLVWIETITPGRIPSFEEVATEQLKSEWTNEKREETKRKAFADIRKRYEVLLPQ